MMSILSSRLQPWLLGICIAPALLALAGCSTLPKAPVTSTATPQSLVRTQTLGKADRFSLEAKLAVQYAGKGYTARLLWRHQADSDDLRIFSPLGQQVAWIQRSASGVTLTDQQGKQHQAADVASLTERLLGWRLPLSGLSQWVLGLPHTGSPYQASYLANGAPQTLQQEGWQIEYDEYQQVTLPQASGALTASLPFYVRLLQQDVRLKLAIQQWSLPPGTAD